jgi:hypothetical protein
MRLLRTAIQIFMAVRFLIPFTFPTVGVLKDRSSLYTLRYCSGSNEFAKYSRLENRVAHPAGFNSHHGWNPTLLFHTTVPHSWCNDDIVR